MRYNVAVLTLQRCAGSVFGWLWEQNISPVSRWQQICSRFPCSCLPRPQFSLLRNSLFFGPMLAGRYTSRRFGSLDDENLR